MAIFFMTILATIAGVWSCVTAAKSRKETRNEETERAMYAIYGLIFILLSISVTWIPVTIYFVLLLGITILAALNQEGKARFIANCFLTFAVGIDLLMANAQRLDHQKKGWPAWLLLLGILLPILVGAIRWGILEGKFKLPRGNDEETTDYTGFAMRVSAILVLTIAIVVVVII